MLIIMINYLWIILLLELNVHNWPRYSTCDWIVYVLLKYWNK